MQLQKSIKKLLKSEYYYFGIIGSIGFLIDTAVFTLLHHALDYPASRIISILTAMTFTWLANRTFTFKATKKICHREWLQYALVNGFGAVINFSVFMSLCYVSVMLKQYYIVPLMVASGVAMVSNFTLSKYYVFRK